jgi:arylsulfatase A-like enzyme
MIIRIFSLLFAVTIVAACGSDQPPVIALEAPVLPVIATPENAPNIVIILADDMGWRDVGYNGSEISTPRIDALAESGVQLERFYAHPICSPTRAALMTGRSPTRLGVVRPIEKINLEGLPLNERLLPEFLAAAGYQPVMAGKWHLGHRQAALLPMARGFEQFYGHITGGIGYWDKVHGGGYDWQRNGVTVREDGYSTHLIANEAVRLIEERDTERPLFLYTAFNAPHTPNEAPQGSIDRYMHIDNPNRRKHAAMVSELDAGVGQIVDALEREGLRENTLLFFLSDNGGLNPGAFSENMRAWSERLQRWFGVPQPIPILEFMRKNTLEGGADNGPFRRGKATVSEGGVRVPGLVSWPGTLPARKLETVVTVEDILPTLADLLGFSPAPGAPFDGASQWASIAGRGTSTRPNFLTQGRTGNEAWYEYPWKLVLPAEGSYELYDLAEDPTEATNLAADRPDRVQDLLSAHSAFPRGRSIAVPFYEFILDPDTFGGEEDREPWADVVNGAIP